MVGLSRKNNLKWAFERELKIPNLTCRQSHNFGPYLGNHNLVITIRPLIITTKYLLVFLVTNDKYDE